MSKRITIKEIAKKAGVSIGTVDRVLHNRGEVAKVTKEKVEKIAQEGNYQANVIARGLRLNRKFNIAVLLPKDNQYWLMMNEGIQKEVAELEGIGIQVTYFSFDRHNKDSFVGQSDKMLTTKPDGVIMAPLLELESIGILKKLDDFNIPYVLVDSNLTGTKAISFIGQDSERSGYLAAKLLTMGYPKGCPVFITRVNDFDSLNKTIDERIQGIRNYFCDNNFDECLIHEVGLNKSWEPLRTIVAEHLSQNTSAHLFVPNSRGYEVVEGLGLEKLQYRIVGFDLTNENEKCLRNDKIDFVLDQNPSQQGALAIQVFYQKFIVKAAVPETQLMPLEILTKENVDFNWR